MGKGDQRSKRGKINAGTYGKTRPKQKSATKPAEPAAKEAKAKKSK